ncbi:MAG TPA: flagellar basal body P-ring formation chaperone FlgA [Oleiagrimonas sp.]|nr:flagellar basal body P-ring formation chaperone FlgA [Oleiagrimonas sp.]
MVSGTVHAGNSASAVDAARAFLQARTASLGGKASVTVHASAAALPTCKNPRPFLPGHNQRLLGRVTVGVRCQGGQTRYLRARVSVIGTYWVAARAIPARVTIDASMVQPRQGKLARLPYQAVFKRSHIIGMTTTRRLAPGTVIERSQLHAPRLVRSRQPVTLEVLGEGFRITRQGKALQNGTMGDTVRVRLQDRSILTGTVAGPNLVRLDF